MQLNKLAALMAATGAIGALLIGCGGSDDAAAATINSGTLENLIGTFKGTPCIFNAGSFTVGTTTYTNPNNPSYWWGNSSLSIGTVGSVSISGTPTAFVTGNNLIRLAFTGAGSASSMARRANAAPSARAATPSHRLATGAR